MSETKSTATKLLEVDEALHIRLKWAALHNGQSMKVCTAQAINDWLIKQKTEKRSKPRKGAK